MAERINALPADVSWNSSWPCDEMPKLETSEGDWILAISITEGASGLVVFYPASKYAPNLKIENGTKWGKEVQFYPFYRVSLKESAEEFCTTFCSLGYHKVGSFVHQDGCVWGFNWSSLTLATVGTASQVADHFFHDRYDEAWQVGKTFGMQLTEAILAIEG